MTAAVLTVVQWRRGLPFNLGWWGFTFPVGVFVAATYTLGADTGVTAFTMLATLLTSAVAGIWLVVIARSLHGLWHGHLVQAPCLAPAPQAGRAQA